jgi:glycosyltransferase involved in cell wall biosynthesis
MPEVSVIIPTYNSAHFLPEAIDSVLAQTFRDYELIIVDDGSTDDTEEVVKRYGDKIKYLRQENRGPGPAKNTGIKNSRGPLIATLDADDKWLLDKLEVQVEYMRSHPQIGLVYGNVSTFDDRGVITEAYDGTHRKVYQGEVFDQLLLQNFISSITIMVRRESLEKVGMFPEDVMISEDWHLWLRIAKEYPIGYIDRPLALYRWQTQSLTWDYAKSYPDRIKVLEKIIGLYPDYLAHRKGLVRQARSKMMMRYGYALFSSGDYAQAREKLINSIQTKPLQIKPYLYLIGTLIPKGLRKHLTKAKSRLGIKFMPAE